MDIQDVPAASSVSDGRYRIGVIASHLPRGDNGGAERQAVRTASELARRGHAVLVFVRGHNRRVSRQEDGVRIVERPELQLRGATASLSPLRFVWDVARGVADLSGATDKLDVLLTYNTLICGFIGAVFSVTTGTPLIVSIRGEGEYRGDRSLKGRLLAPLVWVVATRILVQTPAIAEAFARAVDELVPSLLAARIRLKVLVVPNGVDLPDDVSPPSSQRELLFVGRLVERKGIEHLIRALPSIPGAHLSIVGEGVDGARLERLAAALPVSFSGSKPQHELAADYQRASILVLPSIFGEGLPNAVLEAMAFGRPVVVTRTAGAVDIVQDGIDGVLVEPANSEALASEIRALLDAPAVLDAMGAAARRTAASYTWGALVNQIETILTDVIQSGSAGSARAPGVDGPARTPSKAPSAGHAPVRANVRRYVRAAVGEPARAYRRRALHTLGLYPRVNRAAAGRLDYPNGCRAALVVSADLELAWAWRYARRASDPMTFARERARQGRRNLPLLLDLCERYSVPVTWATVGHLFLDHCASANGRVHPELPRVPYFVNDLWAYQSGDWYDADPACLQAGSSDWDDWYGPDLIRSILERFVPHEIGCHTFSHLVFSDQHCPAETATAELRLCLELAARSGLQLRSFVFPGNLPGNLAALHAAGFRAYRFHSKFDIDLPRRDALGLWRIPGGLWLENPFTSWTSADHVKMLRGCIDAAIEHGLVCSLWFHPEMNQRDLEEILPEVWAYIADRGADLWVTTMGGLREWLDQCSAEPVRQNQAATGEHGM